MKNVLKILLLLLIFSEPLKSQSIMVLKIDDSDFPKMKAVFYAFDENFKPITNLSLGDFVITEEGKSRSVLFLDCPTNQSSKSISSVLVMDASGSMNGIGLSLAKTSAKAWVLGLPDQKSECAITAFDHGNYIIQDFTTNKNLLLNKIESLFAYGGTDYNQGFFAEPSGGMIIVEKAKYKKALIFLTDGTGFNPPDEEFIINKAKEMDLTVCAVALMMPCPDELKRISEATGGVWFERITNTEQARMTYFSMSQHVQDIKPCTIEWISELNCEFDKSVIEISVPRYGLNYKHVISKDAVINPLIFSNQATYFPTLKLNNPKSKQITVTSRFNNYINTDIRVSEADFDINPKSFSLNKDESITLTIDYFASKEKNLTCDFEFISNNCPSTYFAKSYWVGKKDTDELPIKLIHPNGDEVFVAQSDTIITWEGIHPIEKVKIEFSSDNGNTWELIEENATGGSYNWKVPNSISNNCLIKVTQNRSNSASGADFVLIPKGDFIMGNTGKATGWHSELPPHKVTISNDFYMSKLEIKQELFTAVMGFNPSNIKDDLLPAENVSWMDCIMFCNELSILEGLTPCYTMIGNVVDCDWDADGYRLPTSAEWEYACKAGTTTDNYNGNITHKYCTPLETTLDPIAWYCGNAKEKLYPGGLKLPNAFGLYDMLGNVEEWCWDFDESYTEEAKIDPKGSNTGYRRVARGGFFNFDAIYCRSSFKSTFYDNNDNTYKGFRIVRVKK